jgi:hypothetical protein
MFVEIWLLVIFICGAVSHNCQIKFKYSKICHFYKFNENCIKGQKDFCKLIVTKRDELKCPYYICPKESIVDKQLPVLTNFTLGNNNISVFSVLEPNNSKQLLSNKLQSVKAIKLVRLNSTNDRNITAFNLQNTPTSDSFKNLTDNNQTKLLLDTSSKKNVSEVRRQIKVNKSKLTKKVSNESKNVFVNTNATKKVPFLKNNVSKNSSNKKETSNKSFKVTFTNSSNSALNNNTFQNTKVTNLKRNISEVLFTNSSLSEKNVSKPIPVLNKNISEIFSLNNLNNINAILTNHSNSKVSSIKTNKSSENIVLFDSKKLVNNVSAIYNASFLSYSHLIGRQLFKNNSSLNKTVTSQTVKTISNADNSSSVLVNDEQNWLELEKLRNFTNFLKTENERQKIEIQNKINVLKQIDVDNKNWNELEKIANDSKIQISIKQKAKNILVTSLSKRNKELSILQTLTKTMEVNCTTKTCTLEFREMEVVRILKNFFF